MRKVSFLFFLLVILPVQIIFSQKVPLDHSVYDGWQHIGEKLISNNGQWVVYTIEPQQGDQELVIQSVNGQYKKSIPRGYAAVISNDSRYLVFKIKPFFADTREAKIRKKKADDMPKDSLGIVVLGEETIHKIPRVKSFRMPKDGNGWVAIHLEKKPAPKTKAPDNSNKRITDSLTKIIDSLQQQLHAVSSEQGKKKKNRNRDDEESEYLDSEDADGDDPATSAGENGTELLLRNLDNGTDTVFQRITEFLFSKNGSRIVLDQAKDAKDTLSVNRVILLEPDGMRSHILSSSGNEFKNFTFSEDGSRVAYHAEREAKPNALQKFYRVWFYQEGMDSAMLLVDKNTVGMRLGMTVSEFGNLSFSKTGNRLFFGIAPIQPPKDTTLVEFEHAKLDIWHYNDDYLQTVQTFPSRLQAARQENFLCVVDLDSKTFVQLADSTIPQVMMTNEGDGDLFVSITDVGKRIATQWQGFTFRDIYVINVQTGAKKLIKENLAGSVFPSTTGKYVLWYDRKAKHFFLWDGQTTRNLTASIKYPVWNEESDTPEDPQAYGLMGWHEKDSVVYIYDRYDVWAIDLYKVQPPRNITAGGRNLKRITRYVRVDNDEKFIKSGQPLHYRFMDDNNKENGLMLGVVGLPGLDTIARGGFSFTSLIRAKDTGIIAYTKENFSDNPDLYTQVIMEKGPGNTATETRLSAINPQQSKYLWGSPSLIHWKALNGKTATGIVYKPENFEAGKKYPVIIYFYEKLSQDLYDYKEPAPIRSAVNIPFFVSRGYIVFIPDIIYKKGYPGQSAYDYIVSGAQALIKNGWADPGRIALQGHSWGGYQAAQLATMTKMFKAIWAGAPVANMTSAYGGIRWESGVSRQFQYERTQSRIGGSLWEKLPLYMLNSPLFHLDKVNAPMVIMHNDADGAVPWYQGIELFTGLRRLGKKVWMFNYNGQGHGLTQRQDMLDYQIRMQQFFDWILKDQPPAKWITEGVPAVKKGIDWGLGEGN